MAALLDSLKLLETLRPTVVCVFSDNSDVVKWILGEFTPHKVVIATTSQELRKELEGLIGSSGTDIIIKRLPELPGVGTEILRRVDEFLLSAYMGGLVSRDDEVLCILEGAVEAYVYVKVRELGVMKLYELIGEHMDFKVFMAVLQLATEVAMEGREGKRMGALFVLGDAEAVLKSSRQVIINPFRGYGEAERNILSRENWETIKEFATLDGGFVIDDRGIAVASGRYMDISWDIYLQSGLGGRHLAAASISKLTKAVAIVVSASGVVRVFKGGRQIFQFSAL
jgi:DNA integrity scanning protein DisA with diadenylate cyclase activity